METDDIVIRRVGADDGVAEVLAGVLVDCVEGGASVGPMLPISDESATAFWVDVLASADRGERQVYVAEDRESGEVLGTVQVAWATPENQPHRADLTKLLVRSSARRRGVGDALVRAAEHGARAAGRTLLVLDTGTEEAARVYERTGWRRVGVIPRYALWPGGGYLDTIVLYRDLEADPPT